MSCLFSLGAYTVGASVFGEPMCSRDMAGAGSRLSQVQMLAGN